MLKVTLNKKAGSPHLGTIVTQVHNFAYLGCVFMADGFLSAIFLALNIIWGVYDY